MRYLVELKDFLTPLPLLLERDQAEVSRTRAVFRRLTEERERLRLEGSVSSQSRIEEIEGFADRLLRESALKQAEPEIVSRNIRRTSKLLGLSSARPKVPQQWSTAYVSQRVVNPRTIYGTEAFVNAIGSQFIPSLKLGRRLKSSFHLNPRFISRYLALPCVERRVRKEVLFAKKKARGHKVKHRQKPFSGIWC